MKPIKPNYFVILILLPLLISCTGIQKVKVTKVDATSGATSNAFVYSLPQTTIVIDLEIQKKHFVHGPYSAYARDLLGIEGALPEDEEYWVLSGCTMNAFKEPDPEQSYTISCKKNNYIQGSLFYLSSKGLIFDPLVLSSSSYLASTDTFSARYNAPFNDLSPKGYMGEKVETYYKTVFKDSAFVSVPLQKKQLIAKTEEQRASETAQEIYKIRKRRIKMVSSQYTFVPDGKALEICLKELDILEREYLSLFVGKTIVDTFHYRYFMTPLTDRSTWQKPLCRFSEATGLSTYESNKGHKISLSVAPDNDIMNIAGTESKDKSTDQIYYRQGEPCNVLIKQDEKVLFQQRIIIDQLGSLKSMPSNFVLMKQ
jgi:hypothetical protein